MGSKKGLWEMDEVKISRVCVSFSVSEPRRPAVGNIRSTALALCLVIGAANDTGVGDWSKVNWP